MQGHDEQARPHLVTLLHHARANTHDALAAATAAEELAQCCDRLQCHAEAEERWWEALEIRRGLLGERHAAVMATEEGLRRCLQLQC